MASETCEPQLPWRGSAGMRPGGGNKDSWVEAGLGCKTLNERASGRALKTGARLG